MASGALAEVRTFLGDRLQEVSIKRCREGKCSLKLSGMSRFLLLKGDALRRGSKMCDCVIFVGAPATGVVLAELKAKTVHAREVGEKLRNSAAAVADIVAECPSFGSRAGFLALTLANRWTRSELKVLGRERVTFLGKRYPIHPARCGARLSQLMKKRSFAPSSSDSS